MRTIGHLIAKSLVQDFAFAADFAAAKRQCKKGVPCGGTCIAANRKCKSSLTGDEKSLAGKVKAIGEPKPKPTKTTKTPKPTRSSLEEYPGGPRKDPVAVSPNGTKPSATEIKKMMEWAYEKSPDYDAASEKKYRQWLIEGYKNPEKSGLKRDGIMNLARPDSLRTLYEAQKKKENLDKKPPGFRRQFKSPEEQELSKTISNLVNTGEVVDIEVNVGLSAYGGYRTERKPHYSASQIRKTKEELAVIGDKLLAKTPPKKTKRLPNGETFTGEVVGSWAVRKIGRVPNDSYEVVPFEETEFSGKKVFGPGDIKNRENALRVAAMADHIYGSNLRKALDLPDDQPAIYGKIEPNLELWNRSAAKLDFVNAYEILTSENYSSREEFPIDRLDKYPRYYSP